MKNKVESYLVRIYRRESVSVRIAGTVEIIGREKTKTFRSAAELLEIMEIRPLSGRTPESDKRPGKTKETRSIHQKHSIRRNI